MRLRRLSQVKQGASPSDDAPPRRRGCREAESKACWHSSRKQKSQSWSSPGFSFVRARFARSVSQAERLKETTSIEWCQAPRGESGVRPEPARHLAPRVGLQGLRARAVGAELARPNCPGCVGGNEPPAAAAARGPATRGAGRGRPAAPEPKHHKRATASKKPVRLQGAAAQARGRTLLRAGARRAKHYGVYESTRLAFI